MVRDLVSTGANKLKHIKWCILFKEFMFLPNDCMIAHFIVAKPANNPLTTAMGLKLY
jgi:hypothetical protein